MSDKKKASAKSKKKSPQVFAFLKPDLEVHIEEQHLVKPDLSTHIEEQSLEKQSDEVLVCRCDTVCTCDQVRTTRVTCRCDTVAKCTCEAVQLCTCDTVAVCKCDQVKVCRCNPQCSCDSHSPGGGGGRVCRCVPVRAH